MFGKRIFEELWLYYKTEGKLQRVPSTHSASVIIRFIYIKTIK